MPPAAEIPTAPQRMIQVHNKKRPRTVAPAGGRTQEGKTPMPRKKPSRAPERGHRVAQAHKRARLSDSERVLGAMRSGEWLRTQWVARVAFELGTAPWRPDYGVRVQAVLRHLQAGGRVEHRDATSIREGSIAGQHMRFPIPRSEWKLSTTERGA
jgi:hypothetical protein